MSTLKTVSVGSLDLDLDNYRTVHQVSENSAIETMIAISPDSFWSLLDSLIEDGFHPTENIIVQQVVERMVVKEGNRRVAALKIVLGQITGIDLPENLRVKIDALDSAWSGDNYSYHVQSILRQRSKPSRRSWHSSTQKARKLAAISGPLLPEHASTEMRRM